MDVGSDGGEDETSTEEEAGVSFSCISLQFFYKIEATFQIV